jgi:hypothetical protein
MKVDMSPKAIENRLKLVGELTRACLLLRRHSSEKQTPSKKSANIGFAQKFKREEMVNRES